MEPTDNPPQQAAALGHQALSDSDAGLARVTEDLIDILITRGVIQFTDFPPAAQAKLLDRRHAMRFGRLYVHLNADQIASDGLRADRAFDVESLAQAFDWNIDSPTAFLDVDPKVIADTIWNRIVDRMGSVPTDTLAAAAARQTTK